MRRNLPSRAALTVAALCLAVGLGTLVYRVLHLTRLDQTAALFIGLPTLMTFGAALIALKLRTDSARGIAFKAVTIGLLLAGPLLGEGFVCVLFAAPLFYAVALLVGTVIDFINRHRGKRGQAPSTSAQLALFVLPLLVLSLEGTVPQLSFAPRASSTAERIVDASPGAVERALAAPPRFDQTLPPLLRVGFPTPTAAAGAGLEVGDQRTISFGRTDLVMRVAERGPTRVLFRALRDETRIADWLVWQTAEVTWTDLGADRTDVRWTLGYTRRLDPAWYFGPWEGLATTQAADYLIQTAATPRP